jgi:hypothetical protein
VTGYDKYREILGIWADRLSKDCALPIPVAAISHDLGVTIRRHTAPTHKKAHLLGSGARPEISIPSGSHAAQRFSPWDRFLIAHELGHVILQRECNATPLGTREYWQHEKLCDTFARRLLLPDRLHRTAIDCPAPADQKLNFSRYIERIGGVPWPVAAFRVSEWDTTVAFLRLTREADKYRVTVSTFPDKKEVNRQFQLQHPLGRFVSELRVGQSPTIVSPTIFDGLPSVRRSALISVAKISDGEVRVAVVTDAASMPDSSVA